MYQDFPISNNNAYFIAFLVNMIVFLATREMQLENLNLYNI